MHLKFKKRHIYHQQFNFVSKTNGVLYWSFNSILSKHKILFEARKIKVIVLLYELNIAWYYVLCGDKLDKQLFRLFFRNKNLIWQAKQLTIMALHHPKKVTRGQVKITGGFELDLH